MYLVDEVTVEGEGPKEVERAAVAAAAKQEASTHMSQVSKGLNTEHTGFRLFTEITLQLQSINQSIYSFSPMQEVAGIYTDIYYTYWTWYYS